MFVTGTADFQLLKCNPRVPPRDETTKPTAGAVGIGCFIFRAPSGATHMAHSYVSSVFHIVFSTKQRMQLIRPEHKSRLWNYLAGIGRNHGIQVLAVGGMENHVHMLVVLRSDMALSDAVRTLKTNSSRWVRETDRLFAWQQGYGGFSVSPSQLERVKRYIANQPQHHRTYSFEQEFLAMLQAANIRLEPGHVFA